MPAATAWPLGLAICGLGQETTPEAPPTPAAHRDCVFCLAGLAALPPPPPVPPLGAGLASLRLDATPPPPLPRASRPAEAYRARAPPSRNG